MLQLNSASFRRLFHISLATLYSGLAMGQEKGTIKGTVVDNQGKAIEYATVRLYKQADTTAVRSSLSDSLGRFTITGVDQGLFRIRVTAIGYTDQIPQKINVTGPLALLPTPIILEISKKMLGEVNIIATRPVLEQKVDRLVVNVSNSATSAGATALEILRKVPGVVIINEHISLAGKTGVVIMIDGKPSPYTDMESLLKDIPGSNIDKIEVITNPGAQFDASGSSGILNLVLKRTRKAGLTGSFMIGTGYSHYNQKDVNAGDQNFGRYSGSLSLNYNTHNWNIYGNADFLHRNVFEVNNYDRVIGDNLFSQKNNYPYQYNTTNYRIGADYQLSKKSTIGILINGNQRGGDGTSTTYTTVTDISGGALTDSFVTNNLTSIHRFNLTGNLNYSYKIDTTGTLLSADLDFSTFKYKNSEDIVIPTDNIKYYQLGKNPINYITFKANYTHPFSDGTKLDGGFKVSDVDIHNDLTFNRNNVIDTAQSNQFKYKESVQAAYINLTNKYEDFEYQAGIRAERTSTNGQLQGSSVLKRHYIQLFPSISLTQKLSTKVKINFAYSRRIDRPQFVLLSPFSYYIDSLTYYKGNPNLLPQLSHTGKLSLYYGNAFVAVNYTHSTNTIYESAPMQIGNITYTQPDNLGIRDNLVAEINFPFAAGSVISGFGDIQGIYNRYHAVYLDNTYLKSKLSYQSSINLNVKLTTSLKAEVNGFYTSGSLNEFMTVSSFSGLYMGLQQSLFHNKGKLSFSANDIFYKNRTVSTIQYQYINTKYFYRDDSRNFRLTFTYSFGSSKQNNSREHNLGSTEENGRLRN